MERPQAKEPKLSKKKASGRGRAQGKAHLARAKQVPLFSHLPRYDREGSLAHNVGFSSREPVIAPVLRLGLKYAAGTIVGGDARCAAMLHAFKEFFESEALKAKQPKDVDRLLRPQIEFLTQCRPHSVSMGNAIRHIRRVLTSIPPTVAVPTACRELCGCVDRFMDERVDVGDAIGRLVVDDGRKIVDSDVILTFGCSHVVERVLFRAHEAGISFRVVVADSRPRLEGKELLRRLVSFGIRCTYILLNGLSYVMKDVTKCFVGAAAMMSNGTVVSRVGTALAAAVSHSFRKPVIVCCETYKFCERVQLDAICSNELGDPDALVTQAPKDKQHVLADWRDIPGLRLLNLGYDLMPQSLVTLVATEIGLIPPSSVPVIVREFRAGEE